VERVWGTINVLVMPPGSPSGRLAGGECPRKEIGVRSGVLSLCSSKLETEDIVGTQGQTLQNS